jgi:hypothetical protein
MYDLIIPLGMTCNVSFLLQNAKLKKETSLFEWFVTNSLDCITNIIKNNVAVNKLPLITKRDMLDAGLQINDSNIFSGHYTIDEFVDIYKRRADRFYNAIKNNKRILFIRFDIVKTVYTKDIIEKFKDAIQSINPDITEMKLLILGPIEIRDHDPFISHKYYSSEHVSNDPFCKGEHINAFFRSALEDVGYNLQGVCNMEFNDRSVI